MGRNSMPNPGDRRDGKMYEFVTGGTEPWFGNMTGELVSYRVQSATFASGHSSVATAILAVAWADGVTDMLATFFSAGYQKGLRDGEARAQRNIRVSLGLAE